MDWKKSETQQSKDWKKQGLGWVPDYPDARDYTLESSEISREGRPRRDEVTGSIESLAKNLIKALETLRESQDISSQIKEQLEEVKLELENTVFGGIAFKKVRIHKILRRRNAPSDLDSDIVQLKYYLHLLSYHKFCRDKFNPQQEFESPRHPFTRNIEKNDSDYWIWLKNQKFDSFTEAIVKVFQETVNITVDGVVGLETYTAISEYLSDPDKPIPQDKISLIKLIAVPSLIPQNVFNVIFGVFEGWWKKFDPAQQSFPLSKSEFIKLFQQEFVILEPIVSGVLQNLSPLASSEYKYLEEKVRNGLTDLVENDNLRLEAIAIFQKIQTSLKEEKESLLKIWDIDTTQNPDYDFNKKIEDTKEKHPGDSSEEKEERNKADRDKKTWDFYKMLNTIVGGYLKPGITQGTADTITSNEDRFNKSHLLEIGTDRQEDDKNAKFFSVYELGFPVRLELNSSIKPGLTTKPFFFLPNCVDLSFWCSPIGDQETLNACTAFAGIALLEYWARKSVEQHTKLSPLFLYKAARNLMQFMGDMGASVRETMRAMVVFGVPPEKYWSYKPERFDEDPPAFCYSYAQQYQTLKYFRLDPAGTVPELLLFRIKAVLAAGFPCMFGFTVYSSIYEEENIENGHIPYPSPRDDVVGGHAVVAVGYDDYKELDRADGNPSPPGALLIRNSWGTDWGKKGYGWLPYEYVLEGLTADWWSLLKAEWFDSGNFGLGAYTPGNGGQGPQFP